MYTEDKSSHPLEEIKYPTPLNSHPLCITITYNHGD